MTDGDAAFGGTIPATYERLLVPMIFEEPARHLAASVLAGEPQDILETAAGTGVLTRALVAGSDHGRIVATDLNASMLRTATRWCPSPRVTWQVADALDLPFPGSSFDVVACQFGAMFFADKPKGFAQARRVLRPGGSFHFTVWDRIEVSPAWRIVSDSLDAAAGAAPVDFLRRAPYAYFDRDTIRQHLRAGGLTVVGLETRRGTSRSTAQETAQAICHGTPLRAQLSAHPSLDLPQATRIAAQALTAAYGDGPFDAPIGWLQVVAQPSPSPP